MVDVHRWERNKKRIWNVLNETWRRPNETPISRYLAQVGLCV